MKNWKRVAQAGQAGDGWQQGAHEGQEAADQQGGKPVAVEQVVSALMVVGRQVRKPALHRSRIAEPSALYVTDPAPQAGGDGQDNDGQREAHGAFGDQYADQDQQAVARQESGRQQAVFQNRIMNSRM